MSSNADAESLSFSLCPMPISLLGKRLWDALAIVGTILQANPGMSKILTSPDIYRVDRRSRHR